MKLKPFFNEKTIRFSSGIKRNKVDFIIEVLWQLNSLCEIAN